ncbi:hypothetical protein KGM_206389 [Danaus plexippus plexippus]|uniref:Uncharacterized protein n=1 Tax=Danaus plexippus plexippus TaxID=278856 RepID=A0A212EJ26_DANPL|nr:hypothetical protein KGM_206389 [Danaus plexippus plexippus]
MSRESADVGYGTRLCNEARVEILPDTGLVHNGASIPTNQTLQGYGTGVASHAATGKYEP